MEGICLVVGDVMLDKYLYGSVSRISPEAPIPIVGMERETQMLGGAANVAANLRGLGLQTVLCGILGNDYEGKELLRLLEEKGISFQGIQSDRQTTVKTRIIGQAQQIVRIDKEDVQELDSEEERLLLDRIHAYVERADCVIVSDYKKGVCTENVCQQLVEMAHHSGCRTLIDPKQSDWARYRNADLIKPNFGEFCGVAGHSFENTEDAIAANAGEILRRYGIRNLLVTRSQYGMTFVAADGKRFSLEAAEKEVYDVSGAGDTALAALAAGLCWGFGFKEAVRLANVAAGIAVSKRGTYVVGHQEVMASYQEAMEHGEKSAGTERAELAGKLQAWRRLGKRIVFTNGCFDILHRGHIDYLQKAKKLGDILIVGVNSDASVRRLKGDSRPINTIQDRAYLLESISCVDEVAVFEEDTPYEMLRWIKPDILVKGGDYKPEEVVGREFAGEVRILPFIQGYSTSGIIEKLDKSSGRK